MYAIRNRKTKKWVYRTDYRYHPPHQITTDEKLLIFADLEEALMSAYTRKCGSDYEVVKINVEVKDISDEEIEIFVESLDNDWKKPTICSLIKQYIKRKIRNDYSWRNWN